MKYWLRIAAFAVASLGCSSPLHAAAGAGSPSVSRVNPSPSHVEIVVAFDGTVSTALGAKVASWFEQPDRHVEVQQVRRVEPASILSPAPRRDAHIWIVPRSSSSVWLYLTVYPTPDSEALYLVRKIELERGLDEMGMEQVAQIAFLSCEALWQGRAESTRRQLQEELELQDQASIGDRTLDGSVVLARSEFRIRPLAPRFGSPTTIRVRTELGYEGRMLGAQGIVLGPTGGIRVVRAARSAEIGGRVSASMWMPRSIHAGPVELALSGYSLHLGGWYAWLDGPNTWLSLQAGPGLDIAKHSVRSVTDPSIQRSAGAWEVRPMVWLAFAVEQRVGSFRLGLEASVAIQLQRTHYDLDDAGNRRQLLAPWLIQPGVALRLAI